MIILRNKQYTATTQSEIKKNAKSGADNTVGRDIKISKGPEILQKGLPDMGATGREFLTAANTEIGKI